MILLQLSFAVCLLGQAENVGAVQLSQLRYFREQAARHLIFRAGENENPLALAFEPVLRYSSPTGPTSDAAIFVWLTDGRPEVVVSFSIRRPGEEVIRECASFSSDGLECRVDGRTVWSPKSGDLVAKRIPETPAPAESKVQRLVEMRNLARRFSGRRYNWRETDVLELRLLTTPLFRFQASEKGIVDGAIFSFAKGTDPEVLLLLEAVTNMPGQDAYWQYSLARMSSQKQVMRLDEKEIWTVPLYSRGVSTEEKRTGHYNEASLGKFIGKESEPR
jgi:hypothetical protein